MTEHQMMTCARVDSILLDYLEETLDLATRAAVNEHVASCVRCTSLLRDIDSIRSEAERLPELAPSRDLWEGIAARIEPAVVPLGRTQQERTRRWIPAYAAAAAGLVIATAGITYYATSRSLQPAVQRVAVTQPRSVAPTQAAPETTEAPVISVPQSEVAPRSEVTPQSGVVVNPARAPKWASSRSGGTLASRSTRAPLSQSEIAYGDEITRLQTIIAERRNELDVSTITVLEQSLKIIDAAVRQSKAALARDPRSGFLTDQLNSALDKKIELLRTVALLPSRT
jgi:anti-sigma factor RsiW